MIITGLTIVNAVPTRKKGNIAAVPGLLGLTGSSENTSKTGRGLYALLKTRSQNRSVCMSEVREVKDISNLLLRSLTPV